MARIGPVVFDTVGDTYAFSGRVLAFVWEGSGTAGDRCEVKCPVTSRLLWVGRAVDVNIYEGLNLGPTGLHCPNGFKVTQIDAGQVLVYLHETI